MNPTKCNADIYHDKTIIREAGGNWRAKTFMIKLSRKQAA
jgi:hypothetical protein